MRVVVGLGGNALLVRGEPMDADVQRRNVARAAEALCGIAAEHQIVVTHGNGPQIGLLALQAQSLRGVEPYPLDVLGAETEGMIGYMIEQELRNRLPDRRVATLLTLVEVDARDAAFAKPAKPVGPLYIKEDAERLGAAYGWDMAPDRGGWRRVVPSPEPRRIIELEAISLLLEAGVMVVCTGGGGVPVCVDQAGALRGVEAVIDKDLATALLAVELGAEALLLLTDVDAVYGNWRTARAAPIRRATIAELRALEWEPGTMAPKVEAACRFVERGGRIAAIGALAEAKEVLAGRRGTTVASSERLDRGAC